jgi:dihydroorotate dehydrogenase electron transfer subunit
MMSGIESAYILENHRVGDHLMEMLLAAPKTASAALPGQFIHVTVTEKPAQDPLLKRPISIYDADPAQGTLSFLYKVLGRGTEILGRAQPGRKLDLLGPLGCGFTLQEASRSTLLVGGGVGIAPLLYLARKLRAQGNQVTVLHGGGAWDQLGGEAYFTALGAHYRAATMDGSYGLKGLVTELMAETIAAEKPDFVYICGPEGMMAATAAIAEEHHIPGEVSMESFMGCAVGACLGCARKMKRQDTFYVKICQAGPVFDLSAVDW